MKTVKQLFNRAPLAALTVTMLVLALTVELLVFNHHFFTSRAGDEGFAHDSFELPVHPQTEIRLVVMNQQHNVLSLNNLNRPLASITVTARMDDDRAATLQVLARSGDNEFASMGEVRINPAREHQSSGTVHFNHADSDLVFKDLKIVLKARRDFTAAITAIEFNAPEKLSFSWVRFALVSMVLLAAALTVHFRLHVIIFDESRKTHHALNHGVTAMALALCTFFFWASYPGNSNPYYFDFYGEAVYPFNDFDRSLLLPLPETIEENNASGPYEQLLSAMLKGRLDINVFIDPRIEGLKNPYDTSERNHSGVTYTWDRPYYQGKYFVYFGITPLLMVYAPCYALTGMIPAPTLAIYIMSMMAALSMLWAFRSLVRAMVASPNIMLYLLVQLAGLSSSMLWIIHTGLSFYFLPYMAVMVWMSLYTGAIFNLFRPANPLVRPEGLSRRSTRAMLLLAGISIPMVVSSRPLGLLLLIPLTVPAIITIIRENYSSRDVPAAPGRTMLRHSKWQELLRHIRWPQLLRDSLFAIVPVVAGAVLIMIYNYVRFDSISEFGQTYQFTFDDVSAKGLYLGWAHLRNVLYYFFFEPMVWAREFPFVFASTSQYADHGNLNFATDRLSVFTFPLLWGLWLALRSRKGLLALTISHAQAAGQGTASAVKSQDAGSALSSMTAVLEARMGMLRTTTLLTAAAMVFVAYASYYNAAVTTRYLCEIVAAGTYLALVLVLLNFGSAPASASPARHDHAACACSGISSGTGHGSGTSSATGHGSGTSSATGHGSGTSHGSGTGDRPEGSNAFLALTYALCLFFLVKTMLTGLLLALSYTPGGIHMGTVLNDMNPVFILELYRIFTPFGQ